MRISAKGRYALAALIEITRQTRAGETVSVLSVAAALGISKIFLEQVFSQLKKSGILHSTKGKNGGYQLAKEPQSITAYEALEAVENALFEPTGETVRQQSPATEEVLADLVWKKLDLAVERCLKEITLQKLTDDTSERRWEQAFMINM